MYSSQARRNLIARQSGEHSHKFAQILIGWRGVMNCEFLSGGDQLRIGKAAMVPDGARHFFAGLNDHSELLVIDIARADPFVQALEHACNTSFHQMLFQNPEFISLKSETLPLLDFAATQLPINQNRTSPHVNCQLISLFLTQISQIYSPSANELIVSKRLDTARLNAIIDQRLAEPPANAELAYALHLSESHFYCLCQRQFGMTPQQYVMNRRMHRAHFLLTTTKMSLAALAAELGFSDGSSFSRAFKNYYREPPGKVRRSVQQA